MSNNLDQHSLIKSITLHFLPGLLILLVFVFLIEILGNQVMPNMLLFLFTVPLALAPFELGIMYYLGWKRNKRLSLEGIVLNRNRIRTKNYFWLVPLTFIATIGLLVLISSFSNPIYELFDWWPNKLSLDFEYSGYSKNILLLTAVLTIIGAGIIAPIVEEMYFRGFLLPRLSRFGRFAPVLESGLFAIYHFWSPWKFLERTIAWLPITYFAQYKKNIYVGMIVHCLINTIGMMPVLVRIMRL